MRELDGGAVPFERARAIVLLARANQLSARVVERDVLRARYLAHAASALAIAADELDARRGARAMTLRCAASVEMYRVTQWSTELRAAAESVQNDAPRHPAPIDPRVERRLRACAAAERDAGTALAALAGEAKRIMAERDGLLAALRAPCEVHVCNARPRTIVLFPDCVGGAALLRRCVARRVVVPRRCTTVRCRAWRWWQSLEQRWRGNKSSGARIAGEHRGIPASLASALARYAAAGTAGVTPPGVGRAPSCGALAADRPPQPPPGLPADGVAARGVGAALHRIWFRTHPAQVS